MAKRPDQSCKECGKSMEHGQFSVCGQFMYHKDCLKCSFCQKKLEPPNIDMIGNKPHCLGHRGKEVGVNPECPSCKKTVKNPPPVDLATVLGVTYHKVCVKCGTCQKVVEGDQWKSHENILYCGPCYDLKNPKKCQKCKVMSGLPGEIIVTTSGSWCLKCFACKNCWQKINAQEKFHELVGELYCTKCDAAYQDAKYNFDKLKSGPA